MSEPDNRQAAPSAAEADQAATAGSSHHLSRRGWTVLLSVLLVAVFGVLGAIVTVPFVALGPGPTYDTLGETAGNPVIKISGEKTYPTSGELRMTTVSLTDGLTLFGALGLWVSGRYALDAREVYFPPGESDEAVRKENAQQFKYSQSNAEVAALRRLGYPVQVLALEVVPGSPAASVLAAGDELLVVNGKKITQSEDVRRAVAATRPGEAISLTFRHDGEPRRTESITLAKRDDREEGFMGLQPIDRADVPFTVDISLEDVGGPSAGLIFSLAILDLLTPGELVAGDHIAGTGEISAKGAVGPIGGINFKLVAAKEAGADVFLVPARNCAEAVASAPDGMNLVKVATLDDAVTALEKIEAGEPAPSC